jgi:hypothetical protein
MANHINDQIYLGYVNVRSSNKRDNIYFEKVFKKHCKKLFKNSNLA